MPNRLHALLGEGPILADGAMGTMLYDRGVFLNRCYDEVNLTDPALVRSVHEEYLQAGAQLLETNTFGANRVRLARFGLIEKVREINHAGVRVAREAVTQLAEKQAVRAWVAGALGPLGLAPEAIGEAREAYAEQVAALLEAGVDLLVIETIQSLAEAEQALAAVREAAPDLAVAAMMTVDDEGARCLDGTPVEQAAGRLALWGADAVGVNCSTGPSAVLAAIEAVAAGSGLPILAMPNAGVPRVVDGRHMYLSSPEYLASFSRKFLRAGVQVIGGCCGTTPAHIRAMRASLRAVAAQKTAEAAARSIEVTREPKPIEVEGAVTPPALKSRSLVGRLVEQGEFVTLVEVVPPRGFDTAKELAGAKLLAEAGVHAINVPDSPRASSRMSAQALCLQIQQQAGIETIIHYTCRDRNILAIQSDLLGLASLGLKNILCLTGDPPKMGNYPDATAVFDVDAIGLTAIVRRLNHGLDLGAAPLGMSAGFTVAVAANPGMQDIDNEVRRFAYKVEAGAEYAITQPVFDLRLLESFLRKVEKFRIPVIAGIWPLTSLRNAEFMRDLKVAVPDAIFARMAKAATKEAALAQGVAIAQEMLAEARPMVQGVGASAPFGKYGMAVEVLQAVLP